MNRDESRVYYPQYCFHLSRTIDQWCPLRIVDIHDLHAEDAHKAQGIFFLSNHPIVWVRIAGVIVAVDEFDGRFVYTIDDSSGKCIECVLYPPNLPPQGAYNGERSTKPAGGNPRGAPSFSGLSPPPVSEYDVGMVVIIKGSIKTFRDERQLKIHKCQVIRSTDQEVQFWNKIKDFRQEFLLKPWQLSGEELRKCRKEYLKDQYRQAREHAEADAKGGRAAQRLNNRS